MHQIFPSFFDSDKADFHFWKKLKEKDSVGKKIIASYLDKVSKDRNGEDKKVWLMANKNKIYLAQNEFTPPKYECNLIEITADFEIFNEDSASPKFCLMLHSNRDCSLFKVETREEFELWKRFFSQHCICTKYKEKYINLTNLGSGSFANVVLAKNIKENKKYAVKIYAKSFLEKLENSKYSKKMLLNEIQILRLLSHPNIVQLHEVYESKQHIYMVTDVLTGGTLKDFLKSHPNPKEENVKKIMKIIMEILFYLQTSKVIHRDIKLENFLFADNSFEKLVLTDFGLSHLKNTRDFFFEKCGTPGYVAPEIFRTNSPVQHDKIDIFGAGVIFYALVNNGKLPFEGRNFDEVREKNSKCIINFESINISRNGLNLLKGLLAKNPAERINVHEALFHKWFFEVKETQKLNLPPLNSIRVNNFDLKNKKNLTFSKKFFSPSGIRRTNECDSSIKFFKRTTKSNK